MSSLARKISRQRPKKIRRVAAGNSSRKPAFAAAAEQRPPDVSDPGIFCDCYGTLYAHHFEKDDLLVAYLNARHGDGCKVRLISTAPSDVYPKIKSIGLHDDIVRSLTNKAAFHGAVLEILIDDDPVNLRAQTLWDPRAPAFRKMMTDYLAKNTAAAPEEISSAETSLRP
ncbi:MAG: hypothetical protein WC989_04125 [Micavibrio sp.]